MKAIETIKARYSVRSFSGMAIDNEVRNALNECCRNAGPGPFGTAVRFKLLDLGPVSAEELRSLGTYGAISGANCYILGAVKEGKGALEDIGYCLEKIILDATAMGLGTCWLGGTFKRSAFAAKMQLNADEILPAITPVGYPAREVSIIDRLMRFSSGAKKRKPWSDLFFNGDSITSLTEAGAGAYSQVLEAVRIGPSASNRQPWRIVKNNEGCYHLYLKENILYNRMLGKYRLQNIDMGIAMCHFELAARELGLTGNWVVNGPAAAFPGLQLIASWCN